MLPNLAVATLLLIIAWAMAGPISRLAKRTLDRVSDNKQVNSLFGTVVRLIIIGVGAFLALGVLELDKTVTSLLAGVGIVGLALGFAFQDLATNFISGILLSIQRPFRINEIVEAGGETGVVERTRLRSTDIRRFTGQLVVVPNKELLQSPLVNFSEAGKRRVDLEVGVSYDDDLEQVREVTMSAIQALECNSGAKEPEVYFTGFGGSSIDLVARFWITFERQPDYLEARSEAIIAIKKAYDNAQIDIPFPIRTLDLSGLNT